MKESEKELEFSREKQRYFWSENEREKWILFKDHLQKPKEIEFTLQFNGAKKIKEENQWEFSS